MDESFVNVCKKRGRKRVDELFRLEQKFNYLPLIQASQNDCLGSIEKKSRLRKKKPKPSLSNHLISFNWFVASLGFSSLSIQIRYVTKSHHQRHALISRFLLTILEPGQCIIKQSSLAFSTICGLTVFLLFCLFMILFLFSFLSLYRALCCCRLSYIMADVTTTG